MAQLLGVLPEYVLHWLVQHGHERQLIQGEVLYREGQSCSSLYIVLDGLFRLTLAAGGDRVVERATPGTLLGELTFFNDQPAVTTAAAEEPSQVLEIPRQTIADKLQHDHAYASDFYRALAVAIAERLRATTQKLFLADDTDAIDFLRDPTARKAQETIDRFKQLMVEFDKQAIKQNGLTEDDYQRFLRYSMELMHGTHTIIGDLSPLNAALKERLGIRLQHEMLPYVLTTEVAERFYSKPRGYAGDYLAIHGIYKNIPGGSGRLGPMMDRMFLDAPPAIAVRNRKALFAREILADIRNKPAGPLKVLCLASGPASEVFDAFASIDDKTRLRVTLMDIDLQALAFVDDLRTKHKLVGQINLINENLIALFLGRARSQIEPMDLIYSTGLIDYLNDKLVHKLLQFAYANLAPGGRIILGNFHPRNPAREFMTYVLEWNLIHRTEEDMNRLFMASAFGRPCTRIQFEELGIDLFAECVKGDS
jgi:extracellular factor (EF) 3-hydroxypalmitic acid methyl ester biosynthesis protein